MPANEVVAMILEALKVMAIGIPAVFAVLAVFYLSVRFMMLREDRKKTRPGAEGAEGGA